MKYSIYKGHLIRDEESKSIYESFDSFHSSHLFEDKANVLEEYGITDWEQLYSLLNIVSIKDVLKEVLKIQNDDELYTLKNICEHLIPQTKMNQLVQTKIVNCSLGARKPKVIETFNKKFKSNDYKETEKSIESQRKLNEVSYFDSIPNFILASSINHIQHLNTIRAQGPRGTCTSFAVSSANEFSVFNRTGQLYDLSEQHLFYESKLVENDTVCGSWISSAMHVVSNKGQCREGIWSYNPNMPCIQQVSKPSNADNDAKYFINTYFIINQNNIDALKQTLSSGRIIPFSIPIFNSWYRSAETYRTGRITMPFPNELEVGGHSMTLVGYQDEPSSPGGGYFIIRNSWGTDWASEGYYGAGYGVIPYAYLVNYNWEAFAF